MQMVDAVQVPVSERPLGDNRFRIGEGHELTDCSALLKQIHACVFVSDERGLILEATPELARIFGLDHPEDILGRKIEEFVTPEAMEDYLEQIGQLPSGRTVEHDVFTCIQKHHGGTTWISFRQVPTEKVDGTGFIGLLRDIPWWEAMAGRQRQIEEKYRTLMELSPYAITIFSSEGRYVSGNIESRKLYCIPNEEYPVGRYFLDFIVPEDWEKASAYYRQLLAEGEILNREIRLRCADNTVVVSEISAKYIKGPSKQEDMIILYSQDITARKTSEETIRSLSVTDELTGLLNRRGFMIAAEQELKHADRMKQSMALIFFDMDNMKLINDTFGHAEGDDALKSAASIIRSTFRESDIVARWGGDEFVVLALDVPQGAIHILLERFNSHLAQARTRDHTPYDLSMAAGTVMYDPDSPVELKTLVGLADEAMYSNKKPSHSNGQELPRYAHRDASEQTSVDASHG
ncbi:MAG: diguanylate cyclase [Sphaerochaetaceae bacterium]